MKFATEYLWFNTEKKREYINITNKVEEIVHKSGVKEGMVLVSAMHITASIYVNDAESGLIQDIDEWLEKMAPFNINYRHHRTGETNGDAHLKAGIVGPSETIPIIDGKLGLSTWQNIFVCEFDGPRNRRNVIVTLFNSKE